MNRCTLFFLSVDHHIMQEEQQNLLSAFTKLFACYFVFNIEYNAGLVATLEFVQR